MPANCRRSQRSQFQPGNQTRMERQPDLPVVVVVVLVVAVMERVLTHQLTFLTTCMTENLGTRARNQD